ncbi:MAG: ATPase [Haloarculaceae archaeon]
MTLLVAGGSRVDAGKTVFSTGLVARTGAVGYKPRAGNDFWFDHEDYRAAVDQGRLFGKDARKLAAAAPGERAPEEINPVHRLWRPSPRGGGGILGRDDRTFLLDRAGDRYVVNDTVDLPDSAAALDLDDAVRVSSLAEFNRAMQSLHVPEQEALGDEIGAADLAVVESYADVARPLANVDPRAVAVVEPGRATVYDGDRYEKACQVASGGYETGRLEERVGDVTDLLDPVTAVSLPPLTERERADPRTVAEAYGDAYDALLDASTG